MDYKSTVSVFKSIIIFLAGVLPLVGLITAPSIFAQGPFPDSEPPPFVPGEILVKFRPHVTPYGAQRSLDAEGLRTLEISPHSGLIRVQVPPGLEDATRAKLMARGDVEITSLNHIFSVTLIPNDPLYGSQWGLSKIKAPEAWDLVTGSGDVIVAVVDSGLDTSHVEFNGRIVDPYDAIDDDAIPEDTCGHGTHVTGIVAAEGNNGVGVAGVAWGVKILPVRTLTAGASGCSGNEFDVHEGINWAVSHGAKVINLSLGALPIINPTCEEEFPVMSQAVKDAFDAGVLVVAAAGNDSTNRLECPALQAEAMAVGATTSSDQRASYSNYGTGLNIVAPGSGIYSTYSGGGYVSLSGTSMATPHVAGLAGLIWSVDSSLTPNETWNLIQNTADDLGPVGYDLEYGYGRINALRALEPLTSVNLQEVTGEPLSSPISFIADDAEGPLPSSKSIQITTNNPQVLTWTVTISPSVPWLGVTPPISGLVSSSEPNQFTLVSTKPVTYGSYTTTVIVKGTALGIGVIPATNEARINYVPKLQIHHFPLIFKN